MQLTKYLGPAAASLLLAVAGCATQGGSRQAQQDFDALWETAGEKPEVELGAAILAGELAARRGLHEDAAAHFAVASRLSDDPQVAARATQLALQAEDAPRAMAACRRWIELDPGESRAYEIAARLALREGQLDEVVSLLRQVLNLAAPDTGTAVIAVAEVLASEPLELDQAMRLYADVTAGQELSPDLEYGRALVAYRFGGNDRAQQALSHAMTLKPDWRQAQMLALRLHLQAGEMQPAEVLIRDLHVAAPRDIELRLALGSLLLEHERMELARQEFDKALKIEADNVAALYALGLIAMDSQELNVAEKHFRKLMQHGERASDAAYYLGRIAEQRGQLLDAMQYYRGVREGRRLVDAAVRQAVIISRQGDTDAARRYLDGLRSRFPHEELRLYQVEGELLYQEREDAAAEAVYSQALQAYPDDPDLLYGRAVVRERRGKLSQAEADLRRILEQQPDDARALNALGYMLSNHTQRLDEAAGYIERALELTPDDPAIIDSMGWLYFRQGRISEARVYLERAYARLKDPEVAAHLGEVLWLQGERERARSIWEGALQKDPRHPVLRETIERLDSAI